MAKWRITALHQIGQIEKGEEFTLISGPYEVYELDIRKILVIRGYTDQNTLSWGQSRHHWECEIIDKNANDKSKQEAKYDQILREQSRKKDEENKRAKEERKEREKAKKQEKENKRIGRKEMSDDDDNGICIKILFTIFPLLPMWWFFKVPFSLITYPFRKIFSSKNDRIFPSYSFKKF